MSRGGMSRKPQRAVRPPSTRHVQHRFAKYQRDTAPRRAKLANSISPKRIRSFARRRGPAVFNCRPSITASAIRGTCNYQRNNSLRRALISPWAALQWLSRESQHGYYAYHRKCIRNRIIEDSIHTIKSRRPKKLMEGFQGIISHIEYEGSNGKGHSCILKEPKDQGLCICKPSQGQHKEGELSDGDEQLWLLVPNVHENAYYFLYNKAMGERVLEIHDANCEVPSSLRLSAFTGGDHQQWYIDADSRIVSKMRGGKNSDEKLCVDVSGCCDEDGASVISYWAVSGLNQCWQVESVSTFTDMVRIVSKMQGNRVLSARNGNRIREDSVRELGYLLRWMDEDGLVQLLKAAWTAGTPKGILLEPLGMQLGRGTGPADQHCVLKCIREGTASYSLNDAVKSLEAVARLLYRLHNDGFSHNDLHDGNILLCLEKSIFKVIDLGSVRPSNHWVAELGSLYDAQWSNTRDWRAFMLAFIEVLQGTQQQLWDLVGSNASIKTPAGDPCPWSAPQSPHRPSQLPVEAEVLISKHSWSCKDRLDLTTILTDLSAPRVSDEDVCSRLSNFLKERQHQVFEY